MVKEKTINVLIVDSDSSTSRTFQRILQNSGMKVVAAKENQDVLKRINSNLFDVIVISLDDPNNDGIDLLVFSRKTVPKAAKLMAANFPSLETSIKALESGADAVFSKPVAPEQLVIIIRKIVEKNQEAV